MVRSLSYLENGSFKNIGITDRFYMPYFNPIINFYMLQYISSSDSQDLLAGTVYAEIFAVCNPRGLPKWSMNSENLIRENRQLSIFIAEN